METWCIIYKISLYPSFIKLKICIRIVCHAKYLDHTSADSQIRTCKSTRLFILMLAFLWIKRFTILVRFPISIHNVRSFSVYLSACNSCSPLLVNQPWQVRYKTKAHSPFLPDTNSSEYLTFFAFCVVYLGC